MQLDVKKSIENLTWTVDHHFLHIKNQHPFMRAWAVQFEMAYTDFRVIEMDLQLSGSQYHDLLKQFAAAYEAVQNYEWAFARGGLDEFNAQFGNDIPQYEQAVRDFDGIIAKINELN